MLVFQSGAWHDITLPFSDPMLTDAHKQWAAAVVVRELKRGVSMREATGLAEAALYERLYGSRGNNMTPQSTKKNMPV